MAYFTVEMYSYCMEKDTTVAIYEALPEVDAGIPCEKAPAFDGVWLLTRPGGLASDWFRYTRHISYAGDNYMIVMPADGSGEKYERFLTEELPAFLETLGLRRGAAHNYIGAHGENFAYAVRLAEKYPQVFGEVIPAAERDGGSWKQADDSISDFFASRFGANIR